MALALGVTSTKKGKGLLTFDYDRDGDLDVFVVNNSDTPVLYRNDGGNDNDWLRVQTVGTYSNRDGLGAFITVTPDVAQPEQIMVRQINAGSHYLGQSEFTAHFGLGPAAGMVDRVHIKWSSGIEQLFQDVAANTVLVAVEPDPVCAEWVHPAPFPPGDFDHDCRVNITDYALFCKHWLECTVNCD